MTLPAASGHPFALPDVCKIPGPAASVPIPYPNMAAAPMQTPWQTTNAIQRVELQRKHGMTSRKAGQMTGTSGGKTGAEGGKAADMSMKPASHSGLGPAGMQVAPSQTKVLGLF
ncbi:MAG: DUF4150 domain-containing protein [Phycisphaeraceae bacterium]|nr:MAG: DUF4150 domain-containing protein [Phycisphaeraceae bacterium]